MPTPKPYLALSFATRKVGDGGELVWDYDNAKVTGFKKDKKDEKDEKEGKEEKGEPKGEQCKHHLKLSPGQYYLSLKAARDEPIEEKDSQGNIQYRYLHEMWHMEPEDSGLISRKKPTDIFLNCTFIPPTVGMGDAHRFKDVPGTKNCQLKLGEISLPAGDHQIEVLGKFHLCFWHSEESWMAHLQSFKERSGNLKYRILVK